MASADETPAWHSLPPNLALRGLGSSEEGLTRGEATTRRHLHGSNTLPVAVTDPAWRILLRQFGSVIVVLLIVSSAIAAALGRSVDATAILIAIVVDVVLGFIQELRAARDVRALRRLQVGQALVRRGGAALRVDAADVVVGDIVLLESGDRVPADLRLVTTESLRIDESLLTGESVPAVKSSVKTPESTPMAEQEGSAWSGTLVVAGRASGVVVAIGRRTAVGEIDRLVRDADTPTPLQRLMRRFESRMGIIIGGIAVIVFAVGIMSGLGLTEAFLNAVSLGIAAIPEGLPVVLTIALSVGVSRMARHGAVVRSLPAVEALGSTTVIAADKTGTMTLNRMTAEQIWTPSTGAVPAASAVDQPNARAVLRMGALSNDAQLDPGSGELHGDPVDAAIAHLALRAQSVSVDELRAPPVAHIPYEPERRSSATVVADPTGLLLIAKGAVDLLLAASTTEVQPGGARPVDRDAIMAAHDRYAESGMRILAVASRRLHPGEDAASAIESLEGLEFAGLICMSDPPRPGVVQAIAACRAAGIVVMMITGDHPQTAAAIGGRLGLGSKAAPVTGHAMAEIADDVLVARLREARIAARVSPHDKLRIVRALEAHGDVVAVTGDGVNDAPALKAASLGVAMGRTGTDVAREAADIVLTDDDFGTIVRAVRQGRITFSAVQRSTFFLLSTGFAALVAVIGGLLIGGPLIFLPVQMIWFNLVANGLQDVGLAFEGSDGDELNRPPRRPGSGLLSRRLWVRVAVTAGWMGGVVLVAFQVALAFAAPVDEARTLALTTFAFLNLFQTFNARSELRSVFSQDPRRNPFLVFAAVGSMSLQVAAVLTPVGNAVLGLSPLTAQQWLLAGFLGTTVLAVVEIGKLAARRSETKAQRRRRLGADPGRVPDTAAEALVGGGFSPRRCSTLPRWSTCRHGAPMTRPFSGLGAWLRLRRVPQVSPKGHTGDTKRHGSEGPERG